MIGLAEHPIVADDRRLAALRQLDATLFDALLERLKGFQLRDQAGSVVGLDEMHESAVSEPQSQIADAVRLFCPQLLESPLDQPLVLLPALRFGLVAYDCPFHAHAPLARTNRPRNTTGDPLLALDVRQGRDDSA